MIWPTSISEPLVTIIPKSIESLGPLIMNTGAINGASATWPTANLAIFVPFYVAKTIVVKNMFSVNGSAVSGNIDVGIYDIGGNKIISKGSTAQANTSGIQPFSITATELGAGIYYMAIAMDNT